MMMMMMMIIIIIIIDIESALNNNDIIIIIIIIIMTLSQHSQHTHTLLFLCVSLSSNRAVPLCLCVGALECLLGTDL